MKSIPLKIRFENHPIHIGTNLLSKFPELLKGQSIGRRIAIITHPELAQYAETVKLPLEEAGYAVSVISFPSGETGKSMETVIRLIDQMMAAKLDRTDTVIALGGGVVGDVAGFAASIYLRGIHLIQVPTTLLAQVDSAIGGKTGVNLPSGKNLVGTFYQPLFTLVDLSVLATLATREVRSGLAEIVKYGVIGNTGLFKYIETHAEKIAKCDVVASPDLWAHLITRSASDKAKVVSSDEKEAGLREILNFGHTIAHGIEAAFNYETYLHGEAVAIGMLGATRIARRLSLLDVKSTNRIETLLNRLGFTLTVRPDVPPEAILEIMARDKKVRDGKMRFVLPMDIGAVDTFMDIPQDVVETVVKELFL